MAGAIVSWVCKCMGYEEELLRQRVTASWFVLLVAFPVHWITIGILVYAFGVATGWETWYLLAIVPHSLNMLFHSPLSLKFSVKRLSESWIECAWGELFVHGGGYSLIVVSLIGILSPAVDIPFNSITWTSVFLMTLTPLMFLVDHVTNYAPTAIRGGRTPISIVVFHASNGMRFVDPVADFVLGYELLRQAQQQVCPWHRGEGAAAGGHSDCTAHYIIAWTVMTAAVADFLILDAYIHLLKVVTKKLPDSAKHLYSEAAMLLCEVSILISAVVISQFNMMPSATSGSNAQGRDLQGYVVLCGVSTCGSLVTTVLSLVVPQSFWQRLQADGVLSVWKQVLLGLSRYGQAAARRCRNSVAPQHRTPSQQVPPAEVVAPQMSTHVHRRSGRGSVSGGACDVAVAMLVAPEAAPEPL